MSSVGPKADQAMADAMDRRLAKLAENSAALERVKARLQELESRANINRHARVATRDPGLIAAAIDRLAAGVARKTGKDTDMSETLIPTHGLRRYQADAGEVPRLQQRFTTPAGAEVWRDVPKVTGSGEQWPKTYPHTVHETASKGDGKTLDQRSLEIADDMIRAMINLDATFSTRATSGELIAMDMDRQYQLKARWQLIIAAALSDESPPSSSASCRGSAQPCPCGDNDGIACELPGCPYSMPGPVTDHRDTFEIPEGFEAIRDTDGRATGVVLPTGRASLPDTLIGRAMARQQNAIAERAEDIAILKKTLSAMETRAYEIGRKHAIEEMMGTNVAVIPRPAFQIGEQVEKYSGDYRAKGEVRGIFAMKNDAIRFVVEHEAEGGGSFCHIYSEKNLRRVEG